MSLEFKTGLCARQMSVDSRPVWSTKQARAVTQRNPLLRVGVGGDWPVLYSETLPQN